MKNLCLGSGAIEFGEFVLMMSKKVKDSDEELIEAFRVFDPCSTGSINVKEIKKTLYFCGSRLTMEEINDIVIIADADGDGTLSYEGISIIYYFNSFILIIVIILITFLYCVFLVI